MAVKVEFHHFEVEGVGYFPTDMLRYDRCWPADEIPLDSERLMGMGEPRRIRLIGINPPTDGRWRSFGWKVIKSDIY